MLHLNEKNTQMKESDLKQKHMKENEKESATLNEKVLIKNLLLAKEVTNE